MKPYSGLVTTVSWLIINWITQKVNNTNYKKHQWTYIKLLNKKKITIFSKLYAFYS